MGSLSNYAENKILEHSLGKTSWTMPTNVYAALYTVSPTESGGGTEVSASGYARVAITFGSASGGVISNSADIRFPAVGNTSASWGTVVAIGILDASTSGNLIWYGATSATVAIDTGDNFTIATGGLVISLD